MWLPQWARKWTEHINYENTIPNFLTISWFFYNYNCTWSVKHINDGYLHFALLVVVSAGNQVSKARPAVGVINAVVWEGGSSFCQVRNIRHHRIRWDSALLWEFCQGWSDCPRNNSSQPDSTFSIKSFDVITISMQHNDFLVILWTSGWDGQCRGTPRLIRPWWEPTYMNLTRR